MKFTKEQKDAIHSKDGNTLLVACAGSGKTTVLTQRIRYLIEEKGVKPSEIVAITFTVKAADEMRKRIEVILKGRKDLDELFIGTIHPP